MDIQINLVEEQQWYLQYIFDRFQQDRQWPTYREVDRWFTYRHPDLDIVEIWKSLPPNLTNYMDLNQPESRANLTVPAIYMLNNNVHVLRPFLEVIKVCVERYLHTLAESVEIHSEKLLRDYPLWWDIGVYQAGLLLQVEPNIYRSFGGPEPSGHWQCTLAREIRRFRDIVTIENYLERRELPRAATPLPVAGASARSKYMFSLSAQEIHLHPLIAEKCWSLYLQKDYDNAIFNATKAIEVVVRKQAHLTDDVHGATLIAQAFKLDNPLLRYSEVKSEQEGMLLLLKGIMQVYKNPQSHRHVGIQNQSDCLSILLLSSSLLTIIETLPHEQEGTGK